jgi:hypothetical protein
MLIRRLRLRRSKPQHLVGRNEMVLDAHGLSGGSVRRLDLDTGGMATWVRNRVDKTSAVFHFPARHLRSGIDYIFVIAE